MRGSMKSPRRVKAVLPLLEQIIWRHVKCRYKRLCDAVCPSKLSTTPSKNIDSSIILELMSEHGSQPKSQISQYNKSVSLDILDRSIVSHALSQAGKGAKHKPRFAEFACSQLEVYRYAILVTRAVIPHAFWGSQKNFHVIAQCECGHPTFEYILTHTMDLQTSRSSSAADGMKRSHCTTSSKGSASRIATGSYQESRNSLGLPCVMTSNGESYWVTSCIGTLIRFYSSCCR
ncbi:hypothetical protein NEOLEDRAFT_1221248 [Neolentinus lepideus HHB14362 ss-1]|uniref:Uncharacterized protein n=1 Tax=Neolentinus lepideus HHB14362 ss-1 TaxID=1314782 RepID=A0A165Q8F5_9AGAM|nr:hypothetical protein NEOLEDRAFT_1221248 [Neolentinus lepideus HHB14362 ss-1]